MPTYSVWILTSSLLFLSNLLPSFGLGDTLKDHCQTENDKYSVTLIGEQSPPGSAWMNQYVFRVVEKEKECGQELILEGYRPPLSETHVNLSLLDNRLMIRIQSQRRPISPTSIDVFGLPDCHPLEKFVCYSPVVSPASRYIVYEKFFCPHELIEAQDHVVLVYDLTKGATENRLPVVGMTNYQEAFVGIPIYPQICAKERRYRILPDDDPKELGGPTSPILWRGDDEIVFLSGCYDGSRILRIDLKEGLLNPSYHLGPVLSVTECVKPGVKLAEKRLSPFGFVASELIWDGSDAVIVKPSPADYDLKPEIRVPVP